MPVTIDGSNTPTAGGVVYGDGTEYASTSAGSAGGVLYSAGSSAPAFTAAGTSGQVLTSAGASAPTWTSQSALSVGSATTATTATSATTATTATNLAGGGAGQVPYQSASGTTAMLAAGTSGQVLTSSGAGAPSWTTPSAGAMTLISTQTASGASTVQWTGLNYSRYMVVGLNVVGSAVTGFISQVGTGATPTWVTSGYLSVDDNSAALTQGGLTLNTSAGTSVTRTFQQTIMSNSAFNVMATGTGGNLNIGAGTGVSVVFSSYVAAGAAITAVRVLAVSGTISGTFTLYGLS